MQLEPTDQVTMICGNCWESYREPPSSYCGPCEDYLAAETLAFEQDAGRS